VLVAFLFFYLLLFGGEARAYTDEVNRLAGKLICTCGCDTMLISDCECEAAAQVKDFIQQKLDSGVKPAQIIDSLVQTYGEKMLAEPRQTGFGLVAWVTPFAALFIGLFVVFFLIRTWTSRKNLEGKSLTDFASSKNKYRQEIEEELKKWS
jgi:cytochrome c-type biogenesis protein CcmH